MEWKDITISVFNQIQAILKSGDTDLTVKIEIYVLLTGKNIDQVRDLPLGEFLSAYSKELGFLNDTIPQVIPKFWEHDKVKYNISTQVEKISSGQYIDLKEYMKQENNLHMVMAVLCFDGDKYNGGTHKERSEIFLNHMPITIAYPLAVFFFELWSAWSEVTLQYSKLIVEQVQAASPENTDG